ncbi:MAG TPA: chromosome segregation protein SMC [Mycobacteriales bacterium]|nr:chromosome segregation protein SMC [Mycobacteriales bacterium]
MHLKSLTLRGFKSFATATTLKFEPGITAVVGPNGSGKSNVVDAIAWVLGEQGAKALRGGKMEDVIFAGTPGRPALGRAEVVLTIDNSDGALPIDYTEVTISRLMFRSGESEYAINGTPCRLLDVQELLSDSGIGRELHVIVGQGQLDAVLAARPEERRGFIEEAAGVLKHRKRKEKALRKLDAMQANLTRLTDLTAELRRQLKPLGKQAEIARRAAVIQAELRDMRLRLLADDLLGLRSVMAAELRDEEELRARRTAVETSLNAVTAREAELEAALAADAPALARAQETFYRLSSLRERFRGTAELAGERHRHLSTDLEAEARPGRSAEDLEAEARTVREEEAQVREALAADRDRLAAAEEARAALEQRLRAEEQALVATARAQADRREGLARLTGQVNALRTRAAAADEEIGRLAAAREEAQARAERARAEFLVVQEQVMLLEGGESGLDATYEAANAALTEATIRVEQLVAEEREAEREKSFWSARREALEMSLLRRDGAGALVDAAPAGLLGTVAAVLSVRPGYEVAVAAALGALADAVAVESPEAAVRALDLLKAEDAGRAALLVGGAGRFPEAEATVPSHDPLPGSAEWVLDLVTAPPPLVPAVRRLLGGVAVVADLPAARALVEQRPDVTAVTADGDLLSSWRAVGGGASAPSLLEVQAAADEAAEKVAEASMAADRLRFALSAARADLDRLQVDLDRALESLHESDARMAAVAEQLGLLGSQQRAATDEAERLERAQRDAETARDRDLEGLAALEARLAEAQVAPLDVEPDTTARDAAAAELQQARAVEVEVRLGVVAGEERARALRSRAEGLERGAAAERASRERLAALRARRARGAVVAAEVAAAAREALARIEVSIATASAEREAVEASRRARESELGEVRTRRRELAAELEGLTDVAHRDEVARAEQRLRIEALEAKAAEEYGIDADSLVADYGPDNEVPPPGDAEDPTPAPYDRATVERRAAAADRQLALLGKVNPLALEEFSALEERHAYLSNQLEDLKDTRRDLLTVVKEVDDRIHEVFRSAFEDTAREFEHVFSVLFPGGEGKLILTDPDDLLTTGIEVEARPPGKKVKRLSLLSGGERSLTALALLFAIFRARPSPFYLLDEVEAALDDRNLGRLLDMVEEFRGTSQIVIVTHQKRTMEIADSLYGVSMRGDGISNVISQRLREPEEARA